jgi:hypothetical protein
MVDDEGDPITTMDVGNDKVLDLIATAAIDVLEIPNRDAWTRVLVALSSASGQTQHDLRPHAWSVRRRLKQYMAAHPGLSKEQVQCAAREMAETIL